MSEEILIEANPFETRAALLSEGRVRELIVEPASRRSLVGNVYLGRVSQVASGADGAFVELGEAQAGFLPLREAMLAPAARERVGEPPRNIGQCVHQGEALIVQASHDAIADKGPRLTTKIALAGPLLVYTPWQPKVAVSRQIGEAGERERLLQLLAEAREANEGFVVRTAARGASEDEISAEVTAARTRWHDILARAESGEATPPLCLDREIAPLPRLLRDHAVTTGVARIWLGDAATLAEARAYLQVAAPALLDRLALARGEGEGLDLDALEHDIDQALAREVPLPSGGSLIVETTAAMTAIDVNAGAGAAEGGRGEAALKTNLEAAREAARQIRLRSLAGLIAIDFVQMRPPGDEHRVVEALREAFGPDRAPVRIAGLSEFGVAEITRKRVREPLGQVLTEPCATCTDGRVARLEAVAAALYRRAGREIAASRATALEGTAAPELVAWLEADGGGRRRAMEERLGATVALTADPSLARERFELSPARARSS